MINQLFETLASDNGRKFKEDLLAQHKNNIILKEVVRLALDPTINFYIKKIPQYTPIVGETITLEHAISQLDHLATRELTGNAAVEHLTNILSSLSSDDAEVIKKIVQRDLRCGVSESTANKVWKGLIPEYPYMRCLSGECVVETTDGPMTIQDIVDNKKQVYVTSVDAEDGQLCDMPVVGWFDNGHADDNWYSITYEEDGVIYTTHPMTGNHIVFTADGAEVAVDALTPDMCLR